MANEPQSRGAGGESLQGMDSLAPLLEAFEKAKKGGKDLANATSNLNKKLDDLAKDSKRAKDPLSLLAKTIKEVGVNSKTSADLSAALANEFQKEFSLMSTSSRAAFDSQRKSLDDLLKQQKAGSREASLLGAKKRQMEVEAFKDNMRMREEAAKAMVSAGGLRNKASGLVQGGVAALMRNGASIAETAGSALGVSATAMAGIAATAGILIGAFALVGGAIKRVADGAKNAAQAGYATASDWQSLAKQGLAYDIQLRSIAHSSHISVERLQELSTAIYKQGGVSRNLSISFAADIANIATTFGMAGDEAVTLATKLAVLARVNAKNSEAETKKMFGVLGGEAQRLRVPMESLADPMLQLAELAGLTGGSAATASKDLLVMTKAVEDLGKTGLLMFKNMKGADVAKFTKQFTDMFLKIDDVSLAAMTFNKSESFGGMLNRVMGMGSQGKAGAIKNMMDQYGLQGNDSESRYKLGVMLGANPGDFKQATGFGAFGQNAAKSGMSDTEYTRQMVDRANRELASRKTAGDFIAAGGDPLHAIMDMVAKMLDYIMKIAGSKLFGISAEDLNPKVQQAAPQMQSSPARSEYGVRSTNRQRNNIGGVSVPG